MSQSPTNHLFACLCFWEPRCSYIGTATRRGWGSRWWGRDRSFHTCLWRWHQDLYGHLHSTPQQAMPQSSVQHQEIQCRKSTRKSSWEPGEHENLHSLLHNAKPSNRTSDLGAVLLSRTQRGSWHPHSTLTWCSFMKHGGCDQLLVHNKLEV